MKFIFNVLLLITLILGAFIGYKIIVEEKTIAEAMDTVSEVTGEGKVELAKKLLERDLKRRLRNEEFESFNKVKCFIDPKYGTSCKIYNIVFSDKKSNGEVNINVYIHNIFSVLKLTETRSGFFSLDTKIKVELNSTNIGALLISQKLSSDTLEKRKIEKEILSLLNDTPYFEIVINTKKYKYDEAIADIELTTGVTAFNSTTKVSVKFGDVAIDSIESIINSKETDNSESLNNLLSDIYPRKVQMSANMSNNFIPKLIYLDRGSNSEDFITWKENFDNSKYMTIAQLRSGIEGYSNINTSIVNELINFIYGDNNSANITIDIINDNLDLVSIFSNKGSFDDINIR